MHLLTAFLIHAFSLVALCPFVSALGASSGLSRKNLLARQRQLHIPQAPLPAVLAQDSQLESVATTSENYIWLLGIPISLLGSTLSVLGLLIQKMSHGPEQSEEGLDEEKAADRLYCLSWQWMGGLLLFGTGNLITWAALGMAPNSVLACFNSWNIVFSLIIAPRWFENEVVSRRTWYCAAVLVVGCTWVAIAGPRSYRLETVEHISRLFGYPAFQVCSVVLGLVFVVSVAQYSFVRRQAAWQPTTVAQIVAAAAIGASYAVLFSKCTSSLVQSSFATGHSEMHGAFYTLAALTFFCALAQLHFLNEGMKHGAASFVVPFYQSSAMAIQIVAGGMLFQEYVDFTLLRHLAFWPGVVLVFCGVVALTKFAEEDKAEEQMKLAAHV